MISLRHALLSAGLWTVSQPGFSQPASLAMDVPIQIAGIETVCTGVGLEARENPDWGAYALKVEIAGNGGNYLGDERVTLRHNGADILSANCAGPWLLFQLPPGRYAVEAEYAGRTVSSAAMVSAGSQSRIILRFPDGENPPYALNYSDEAARALGVRKGHVDVFSITRPPQDGLVPNVRGGLDKKGPAIQLQWPTN